MPSRTVYLPEAFATRSLATASSVSPNVPSVCRELRICTSPAVAAATAAVTLPGGTVVAPPGEAPQDPRNDLARPPDWPEARS